MEALTVAERLAQFRERWEIDKIYEGTLYRAVPRLPKASGTPVPQFAKTEEALADAIERAEAIAECRYRAQHGT